MIINKQIERKVIIFWLTCSFIAAHLCFWLSPNVFETWNEQTVDRLLLFRSNSRILLPYYDDTIVHVDLNNTSMQSLNNFYLDRTYHAQVIRNLALMNVSAQMYDFIFAAPTDDIADRNLIEAARKAGNVYFGMAFRLARQSDGYGEGPLDADSGRYLDTTKWKVTVDGHYAKFYMGKNPLITFPPLAEASRGLGYLSLKPDLDGVFRRLPLLVRYDDAFYPSFSFRAVCGFLNIPPDKVIVKPGKTITLKDARRPGSVKTADIVIPVDKNCNMRINFVGSWERMKHYNFSDVYYASEDRDELEMWKEELKGKIILISDNSTGSSDAGPVPTDTELPLSGVHANAVHTILTESFLKELSGIETLFVELILLLGIMLLSFRYSSFPFTLGALGVAGGYICIVGLFFFYANVIFPIVRPLLMMGFALISIQIASAVENVRTLAETERAKEVAERDLDIGRQIQSGFLPNTLPSPSGWEIVSHFKAARQVAGDFYDFFKLGNRECIGIVIADVCDKGVGAALFMALIRSLIRAFAMQNFGPRHNLRETSPNRSTAPLLDTIKQTNNYIVETHSESGMFATLFFGVLDPESGVLNYINCGHEPPIAIGQGKIKEMLKPTGPAVGLMPNPEYKVQEASLQPGDILFAFTDGVTDAQNEAGEFFTKARLLAILASHFDSAEALMDRIKIDLYDHISAAGQFDDVTMIAMRRKNGY